MQAKIKFSLNIEVSGVSLKKVTVVSALISFLWELLYGRAWAHQKNLTTTRHKLTGY